MQLSTTLSIAVSSLLLTLSTAVAIPIDSTVALTPELSARDCQPGTYVCVDPSRIRIDVCTVSHEWTPAAYCGYHQVCDVASNGVPFCRNNF